MIVFCRLVSVIYPLLSTLLLPIIVDVILIITACQDIERMADTSGYTIEERLVAAVWVHECQMNGKSMGNVMDDFVTRFAKSAPTKKTLLAWCGQE